MTFESSCPKIFLGVKARKEHSHGLTGGHGVCIMGYRWLAALNGSVLGIFLGERADPEGMTMVDLNSVCNWDEMEWEIVRPGVKRKVFQAVGGTLVLNHLEPGHTPRLHSHAHEQIVYILQGEAEFAVDDKVFNLRSGSLLTIPPHAKHLARVTGRETLVNLDVFFPRREDYPQSRILGKDK